MSKTLKYGILILILTAGSFGVIQALAQTSEQQQAQQSQRPQLAPTQGLNPDDILTPTPEQKTELESSFKDSQLMQAQFETLQAKYKNWANDDYLLGMKVIAQNKWTDAVWDQQNRRFIKKSALAKLSGKTEVGAPKTKPPAQNATPSKPPAEEKK